MTRLAILADIHGNLPALKAVMEDMAQFKPDHVILPGDIVNWGPHSAEVMELVTRMDWALMRGNNEYYLLDYQTVREPEFWADYKLKPWLYGQLNGHWHNVIAAWPDELHLRYPDAPPIRVVHGRPGNPWHGIFDKPHTPDDDLREMLQGVDETFIIAAHTHLVLDRKIDHWRVVNPGSVGVPLAGHFGAHYMLLDGDENGWEPTFRRVEYDLAPLLEAFEKQQFVEKYGATAYFVVREFQTARLYLLPFQRWRAATHPGEPESMAMVDEFEQVDPWDYTPAEYHVNRD